MIERTIACSSRLGSVSFVGVRVLAAITGNFDNLTDM